MPPARCHATDHRIPVAHLFLPACGNYGLQAAHARKEGFITGIAEATAHDAWSVNSVEAFGNSRARWPASSLTPGQRNFAGVIEAGRCASL